METPEVSFDEFTFYVPEYTIIENNNKSKTIQTAGNLRFVFRDNKLVSTL